ncbi:ImmA/IrrE family metallo-endopeptidase [Vibrio parahaemolyticus]|nr:ImmA/IrrE family metallo-endopeptidase [Vibrio parahaemolyticus]
MMILNRIGQAEKTIINKFQNGFPVKIGSLASELGLVVKKATLPGNISGSIKQENGLYVIRVNSHDVRARQRFTIAHEVAHFLLHKHLIGDGIIDNALYRSSLPSQIEWEANELAAQILMPSNHFLEAKKSHEADLKKEALYEKLAEVFEVSVTAIKYRLDGL